MELQDLSQCGGQDNFSPSALVEVLFPVNMEWGPTAWAVTVLARKYFAKF